MNFLEMEFQLEIVGELAGSSLWCVLFGGKFKISFFFIFWRRSERMESGIWTTKKYNLNAGKKGRFVQMKEWDPESGRQRNAILMLVR